MSERDCIEEKFIIKDKEGNKIYAIYSSVPLNLFEIRKDDVRIINNLIIIKLLMKKIILIFIR